MESEHFGHAFEHYKSTMHIYAMELESKKVWDFSREDYVQRLIQNEVDGKLVEADQMAQADEKTVEVTSAFRYNKKLESLNIEYNTVLLKTLDEQR